MALEVAFTAMYLRLEGWRSCSRASWQNVEALLRQELEPCAWCALLRRHGFWQEALILDDPARCAVAYCLVRARLVLTVASACYPEGWRRNLRFGAPPALWCLGECPGHGLGFVGSRELDRLNETFAFEAAKAAVHAGFSFVSGGAKGADSVAAMGAMAGLQVDSSLCDRGVSGSLCFEVGVTSILARGFSVGRSYLDVDILRITKQIGRLIGGCSGVDFWHQVGGDGDSQRLVSEEFGLMEEFGVAALVELRADMLAFERCCDLGAAPEKSDRSDESDLSRRSHRSMGSYQLFASTGMATCCLSLAMPGTRFSAALAMERNPLIYSFGSGTQVPGEAATIVVQARHGTGGTWAGATDCLRRRLGSLIVFEGAGARSSQPCAVEALAVLGGHLAAGVPAALELAGLARSGGLTVAGNGVRRVLGSSGVAEQLELGWGEGEPKADAPSASVVREAQVRTAS